MSVIRSYTCNLCGTEIEEVSSGNAHRTRHHGVGIYFGDYDGATLKFTPLPDSDNHLCNPCVENIVKAKHDDEEFPF